MFLKFPVYRICSSFRLNIPRLQLSFRQVPRRNTRYQYRHLCEFRVFTRIRHLMYNQGTIIVVLGVIGIVAFGSINSGLAAETDVDHLTYLWRRGGWLAFFFFMSFALILLLLSTSQLDAILAARSEISALPLSTARPSAPPSNRRENALIVVVRNIKMAWIYVSMKLGDFLEQWNAAKDDKTVAWSLGIAWACAGGGLAGGTLVL